MLLGHFGVGLAAKKVAPEVSLGTLFLAAQLADLIWPNLVLLGIEKVEIEPGVTVVTPLNFVHYPYSHSLLALILWGAFFWVVYGLVRRAGIVRGAILMPLVISHWVLDLVTHRPDLPLGFGITPKVGLGLWNSLPGTLVVELIFFFGGLALYLRSTRARDRTGSIALWALVVFLLWMYLASIFGPPPPSAAALPWMAQGMWLVVAWGYWVDRHREPRAA